MVLSSPCANRSAGESGLVRLIDRLPYENAQLRTFDGTTRRVLSPRRRRREIPLDPAPSDPFLRFSASLEAGEPAVAIRFRAILRLRDGSLRQVYDRKLDVPGWHDEQVDLGGFDLAGAVLVLKRNVVGKASRREVTRGAWGEPMLLPAEPAQRESVVLVSLDTLRADRVGAYGSSAGLTPALDAFAETSVVYEHAYSPSTWTLPSHFSMFRGVPAFRGPQTTRGLVHAGRDDTTALASVFRDAGYLTAGFTGGGFVSYHYGFSDGFDSYYSYPRSANAGEGCSPDRFDGPEVLRQTRQWLRENGHRPFFLFVHTYDAHDRCPVQGTGFGDARWDSSPAGQKRISEYYNETVSKADGILAGVLAEVAALNPAQRTTVAVTSDHGEHFWEHGTFGHGCAARPYEQLVRVPLIVRSTARHDRGERVTTPVSVGSIAPTLLALAGLPHPASMVLPLLPGLGLDSGRGTEPVYVSCENQLAVRSGRYKLITIRNGTPIDEVYDLENDPGERENLAGERPALTAELRRLAGAYWQQARLEAQGKPPGEERVIDEITRERLRALGYLE
jgi:arylsulfatase A-like enzyme